VFGRRYHSEARIRDTVLRERLVIAFKALPSAEAQAMEARILEWLEAHKAAAAAVAAPEQRPDVGPEPDAGTPFPVEGGALRHISNPRSGVQVDFPAAWKVEVRAKKKPRGKTFFDRETWIPPEDASDWNVARGTGRMHTSVEVEVFETEPTVTFENMTQGRLARLAGDLVDSSPNLELNGLRGYSVTRRTDIRVDPLPGQATLAATVVLWKHTVLHDGKRQVHIVSTSPEDSPDLERLVENVVRSVRLS